MTKKDALTLTAGTPVYCTVSGCAGWYGVLAVRPRDGYLKISGFGTWNPPHNFSLTDGNGRGWEA